MEAAGTIAKIDGSHVLIAANIHPEAIAKRKSEKCTVVFEDGRRINREQQKKAHAILGDISEFTGDVPEYTKALLKNMYIARYGGDYFSLSTCTVTKARDFISFLIDFCFEQNIGTRDTLLNTTDDISRYLYSCIANRKCAICNAKAEIHHCTGSKVGMGFNCNKIENLGRRAVALCRRHHNQAHNDEEGFFKAYHIYGIALDDYLLRKTGL